MKIVVLDGYTLNPGDLDWTVFEPLGELEIHDRTPPEQVLERARGAQAVLTNKTVLDRGILSGLPELRYIGVLATGYNVVDVEAAREKGIAVTNVPAYGTESVAQMAFALLLELAAHVAHHAETVREGRWTRNPDFCYWDFPIVELSGLTMGIVGYGRIGRAAARIALAFGMRVIVNTRSGRPGSVENGVEFVELDDLFRRSDVISLHCPLTPENERFVNAERLLLMKAGAMLINTSRGPLVDESALAAALNAGRIAGAGLDVLSVEQPPDENPLLTAKNCFITPHIAWASHAARKRLLTAALENLKAFLEGEPRNVVNA
jgi:glycerate dehydrogenase